MHLSKGDIANLERIKRLNIVNAVTGIKPANLIGTCSQIGRPNLAIFSSIVHLGSQPPLLGLVSRPSQDMSRHTLENILDTRFFTVNHIHEKFVEQAHYTSAKFDDNTSEFDVCHFTEEYLDGFMAPYVKESQFKLGLKFMESLDIKSNNTMLIVGEIQHLYCPEDLISEEGYVDLEAINDVGISGLNTYYRLQKIADFPYARVGEVPNFDKK